MNNDDNMVMMERLLAVLERSDERWDALNGRLERLERCLEAIGAGMERIEQRFDCIFTESFDEEFPEAADWADPGVRSRH